MSDEVGRRQPLGQIDEAALPEVIDLASVWGASARPGAGVEVIGSVIVFCRRRLQITLWILVCGFGP